MDDYPKNLSQFENWFSTEEDCREYLFRIRWPNIFQCPRCGHDKTWPIGSTLFQCAGCNYQLSVIAGTIFQDTHQPLTMWFRAIWWVTGQKNGASALGLQRILGLGSYRTAWAWLHKLRRAMVTPGRDRLSGTVEIDETYIGGEKPGKRGRGAAGKTLVLIATEVKEEHIGRIRLRNIPDASAESLEYAILETVELNSTIRTDGWSGYSQLSTLGFFHEVVQNAADTDKNLLPACHRVASLLKRWLLGTHQGAVSQAHLGYYLDEFTFRFNRRTSHHRGLLFYRLLQNATAAGPTTFEELKKGVRGRKPLHHKI